MIKKVVKDIYIKVCKAEVFLAIIFLLITVFVIFIAAVSRIEFWSGGHEMVG